MPAQQVTVVSEAIEVKRAKAPRAKAPSLRSILRRLNDLIAYAKAGLADQAREVYHDLFFNPPDWYLAYYPDIPPPEVIWFNDAQAAAAHHSRTQIHIELERAAQRALAA